MLDPHQDQCYNIHPDILQQTWLPQANQPATRIEYDIARPDVNTSSVSNDVVPIPWSEKRPYLCIINRMYSIPLLFHFSFLLNP